RRGIAAAGSPAGTGTGTATSAGSILVDRGWCRVLRWALPRVLRRSFRGGRLRKNMDMTVALISGTSFFSKNSLKTTIYRRNYSMKLTVETVVDTDLAKAWSAYNSPE